MSIGRNRKTHALGLRGDGVSGLRIAALCMLALLGAAACREERKIDVAKGLNPEKMPTMKTRNVATLISDSGVVRYKIVAPVWYVYDQVDTPYWSFPEGLYLRKYDDKFKEIASVAADSAHYFKHRRLWRLDGHVEMKRAPGDLFLTTQLFWNERDHKIYSDSFIHIQTPTQILEGFGFVSNERLSEYTIMRPSGAFPAEVQE